MSWRLSPSTTVVKLGHEANARFGKLFTLFGMAMLVNPVPLKADSPITSKLSGKTTCVKAVHSLKVPEFILSMNSGIVIDANLLQPSKALLPRSRSLVGSAISSNAKQFWKA